LKRRGSQSLQAVSIDLHAAPFPGLPAADGIQRPVTSIAIPDATRLCVSQSLDPCRVTLA